MNSQRGKASTNASRQNKSKNQRRQATKSKTNGSNNNKKRSAQRSRPAGKTLMAKSPAKPVTQQYLKTLADPFEFAGVPLGFGSLVPTRISTIYLRGSTAANADGSLALAVFPQAYATLQIADGGAAVSFAGSGANVSATDLTAISANYGSGRLVSIGIKAYPNLAATAVPGLVVAGAVPGSDLTLFQALTPNDLVSFPTSHVGKGYEGAVACGRPQDTVSFEFYQQVVNATGFLTTTDFPCSIPYVCFEGIGNATLVYYEVTINIEGIETLQHSAAAMGMGMDNARTLASEWVSLEAMWSSVKVSLPDPGRIGYDILSGTGTTVKGLSGGGNLDYGGQLARSKRN